MIELRAKYREDFGKKAKNLRRSGFLPAVIYGEGVPSKPVSVSRKEFEQAYKKAGESAILKLEFEGKLYNVLIHDVAVDPLKNVPLHADFYAVRMDRPLRARVTLEFLGESPAVKNEGGILVKVMQELEVEALPKDLPHTLKADLSVLKSLEEKLLVRDLVLPSGVKILAPADEIVVLVETPRSAEEIAELSQAPLAPEAPAEVKTEREVKEEIKEKKKEETSAAEEKS